MGSFSKSRCLAWCKGGVSPSQCAQQSGACLVVQRDHYTGGRQLGVIVQRCTPEE